MNLGYSRLIIRTLLSYSILTSTILISACTTLEPTNTSIPPTPASAHVYSAISATTELLPLLSATSMVGIPVSATLTLAINFSAKHIPTKTLVLYSDGHGIYSYPENLAFSHPEVKTLYTSGELIENLPQYLVRFGPQFSSTSDAMLIPSLGKEGKTWLLSLTHGTLRQAVDKAVVTVWKPNGKQFAYLRDDGLYIQDAFSMGMESHPFFKTGKELGLISWSPDGNWLSAVERTGNVKEDYNFWLISSTGEITRLLGTFSLPATELSTETVLRWSPTNDLVWVNTSNGNVFLTLKGEIVNEMTLPNLEWVFCNTQRPPIKCIQQTGVNELNGYTRIAPTWVLCQQHFWSFSHSCRQRAIVYQNKLYINNIISGELQEIATIDHDINNVKWTPNDEYLIFDTLPLLSSLHHTENFEAEIYSFSLATGEVALLPIQGTLIDIISTPK